MQVEGELVSRKRLEELAPEQFSSILILADESATFSTADVDQVCPTSILNQKIEEYCWHSPIWRMQRRILWEVG